MKNAIKDIIVAHRRLWDVIWRCTIKRKINVTGLKILHNWRRVNGHCSRCGEIIIGECYLFEGGKLIGRCCYPNPIESLRLKGKI